MRKNKNAYMKYVCPYCWNRLNKCTCKTFPPYHLVFVDENIQDHVRILNEKGYKTTGSCEGHMSVCLYTYLSFPRDYFDSSTVPDGFSYNDKKRSVICGYPNNITKEKFEELKKEKLATLLEWCNSLPNKNAEN